MPHPEKDVATGITSCRLPLQAQRPLVFRTECLCAIEAKQWLAPTSLGEPLRRDKGNPQFTIEQRPQGIVPRDSTGMELVSPSRGHVSMTVACGDVPITSTIDSSRGARQTIAYSASGNQQVSEMSIVSKARPEPFRSQTQGASQSSVGSHAA